MINRKLLLVAFLSFIALGCNHQQAVDFHQQTNYDFSQIKNFYLLRNSQGSVLKPHLSYLLESEIYQQLQEKGLTASSQQSADVLVAYFLTTEENQALAQHMVGFDYYGGLYEDPAVTLDCVKGKLLVQLIDKNQRKVIWQAVTEDKVVKPIDEQDQIALLKRHTKRVLSQLPSF